MNAFTQRAAQEVLGRLPPAVPVLSVSLFGSRQFGEMNLDGHDWDFFVVAMVAPARGQFTFEGQTIEFLVDNPANIWHRLGSEVTGVERFYLEAFRESTPLHDPVGVADWFREEARRLSLSTPRPLSTPEVVDQLAVLRSLVRDIKAAEVSHDEAGAQFLCAKLANDGIAFVFSFSRTPLPPTKRVTGMLASQFPSLCASVSALLEERTFGAAQRFLMILESLTTVLPEEFDTFSVGDVLKSSADR